MENHEKYLPTLLKNSWLADTTNGYEITQSGMISFLVWKQTVDYHSKVGDTLFSNIRLADDEYEGYLEALIRKGYICKIWKAEVNQEVMVSTKTGMEIFESLNFYLDKKKQRSIKRRQDATRIAKGLMKGIVDITTGLSKLSPPPPSKKTRGKKKKSQKSYGNNQDFRKWSKI